MYMKVLTIKEPYATLIKEGYKEYEFRTWKTNFRGEFLIHAGKSIDKKAMEKYKHLNLNINPGHIIAKAKIIDCIKIDDDAKKMLSKINKHEIYTNSINSKEEKLYGFKVEDVKPINPIEVSGKLSFWEYNL